jgi:starch synthase
MKILFVAAEASPLVKIGGLADVIGSLPAVLAALGHEVRTVIPAYSSLAVRVSEEPAGLTTEVGLPGRIETVSLRSLALEGGRRFYLVRDSGLLCGSRVYTDNDIDRFFLFSRAVVDFLPALDFKPDIVHCHDWHTALVPMWLSQPGISMATVFTIHNLSYQGLTGWDYMVQAGIYRFWEELPPGAPWLPPCFMAQGILRADALTAVSHTYAREIITPALGEGLNELVRFRSDSLTGITNGLNPGDFDPATDRYLAANYGPSSIEGKSANKLALQQRLGLPVDSGVPLIGMVGRLDEQKGLDIVEKAVDLLAERDIQLVVVGHGRQRYESMVRDAASRYPSKIAAFTGYDEKLASLVYAGSDLFLMPSRFEPCGLGQMIAMRYGSVPVARLTGGLADTVSEVNTGLTDGRGFVFADYTAEAMLEALDRAVAAFRKPAWAGLVRRIMGIDFSWRNSDLEYEAVYRQALEARRARF